MRRKRRSRPAQRGMLIKGETPHVHGERGAWRVLASGVAIAFGLLTIWEGGNVLFGSEAARRAAGDYVPFVLWFNFIAGFAYVIAGAGLWMRRLWAPHLAVLIAAATALTFAAFGVHVYAGGAYEQRTIVAMALRTLVWTVIAVIAHRLLVDGKSARNE
jgi:hypothetical protein